MRALLVEDDHELGDSLKRGLELNGYSVEWMDNGADAIQAVENGGFDIAILDINLPDINGKEVLKLLRTRPEGSVLPVVMLTALDALEQKVNALDAGADDYLTKPFELAELLARMRVLLRRSLSQRNNLLRCKTMTMDLVTHTVSVLESGQTYVPTANEFKVLSLLMMRPGQMVSRARIEEVLHGWEGEAESNNVEVTIYNLRRKLGKEVIHTMRGVGYMVLA